MTDQTDTRDRQNDLAQFERDLDALLLGVSLEAVIERSGWNSEEQELLVMADKLTHARLGERSQIRDPLGARLMGHQQAEQEIREAEARRKKKRPWWRRWYVILIAVFIGLGMIGAIIDSLTSNVVNPSEVVLSPQVEAGQPFPQGGSDSPYPVYTVDNVIFGGIFRLKEYMVFQEPWSEYKMFFVWEALQPVAAARYSITFKVIDPGTGEAYSWMTNYTSVNMPTENRLTFATCYTAQDNNNEVRVYHLEIYDQQTGELLLLPNGLAYFELRSIPSSVVPSAPDSNGIMELEPTLPPLGPTPTPTPIPMPTP